jgi:hypothetical protein
VDAEAWALVAGAIAAGVAGYLARDIGAAVLAFVVVTAAVGVVIAVYQHRSN